MDQWLDSIDLLMESDERRGIGKVYQIFIGENTATSEL